MYRPIRSTGFEAEAEAEAEVLCTRHTRCVDTLSTVVKQKTAIVPDFTHRIPHNVWCVCDKRRTEKQQNETEIVRNFTRLFKALITSSIIC